MRVACVVFSIIIMAIKSANEGGFSCVFFLTQQTEHASYFRAALFSCVFFLTRQTEYHTSVC